MDDEKVWVQYSVDLVEASCSYPGAVCLDGSAFLLWDSIFC